MFNVLTYSFCFISATSFSRGVAFYKIALMAVLLSFLAPSGLWGAEKKDPKQMAIDQAKEAFCQYHDSGSKTGNKAKEAIKESRKELFNVANDNKDWAKAYSARKDAKANNESAQDKLTGLENLLIDQKENQRQLCTGNHCLSGDQQEQVAKEASNQIDEKFKGMVAEAKKKLDETAKELQAAEQAEEEAFKKQFEMGIEKCKPNFGTMTDKELDEYISNHRSNSQSKLRDKKEGGEDFSTVAADKNYDEARKVQDFRRKEKEKLRVESATAQAESAKAQVVAEKKELVTKTKLSLSDAVGSAEKIAENAEKAGANAESAIEKIPKLSSVAKSAGAVLGLGSSLTELAKMPEGDRKMVSAIMKANQTAVKDNMTRVQALESNGIVFQAKKNDPRNAIERAMVFDDKGASTELNFQSYKNVGGRTFASYQGPNNSNQYLEVQKRQDGTFSVKKGAKFSESPTAVETAQGVNSEPFAEASVAGRQRNLPVDGLSGDELLNMGIVASGIRGPLPQVTQEALRSLAYTSTSDGTFQKAVKNVVEGGHFSANELQIFYFQASRLVGNPNEKNSYQEKATAIQQQFMSVQTRATSSQRLLESVPIRPSQNANATCPHEGCHSSEGTQSRFLFPRVLRRNP